MEDEIIRLIDEKGPLTGAEIMGVIDGDPILLWRTCKLSKSLNMKVVGTKYMRLDRRIDGFARLSPSILREFLTYSVIGLASDPSPIEKRAISLISHIEKVSRAKSDLAYRIISALADRVDELLVKEKTCFIIAGDIVFNMAHDVPRPERSTGKLVKGSDMDIVVVVDDSFPKKTMERLDEEIYREKYNYLINPYLLEEIDYIVKYLDRVRKQLKFDTFPHMVACKILKEGAFLYGNEELFHILKIMLKDYGVIEKLDEMEEKAKLFRGKAEEYLLIEDPERIRQESLNLFYPTEESEEFV